MTIQLPNDIDVTSRRPRTAIGFDAISGVQAVSDRTRHVLLVGQMTSAGTALVNTPTDLFRSTDSEGYFGPGSILDLAAKAAFIADPLVKLSAVAVADAGGAAAAAVTVTFANNLGVDNACTIVVGNHSITFAVYATNTPTALAVAAQAAVTANPTLPFTASHAAGVLTLTWKNKGTCGNGVPVSVTFSLPLALVLTTITLGAATFAAGATDPDIATALAATAGKRYNLIAVLFSDSTNGGDAKAFVTSQGDAEHQMGELAIQVVNDTLSTATTLSTALDGPRSLVYAIHGSPSHPAEICGAVAAVMSSETDPARPYNTLTLPGIAPPPITTRWIKTEQDTLLNAGASPLLVGAGDAVYIQRAVVTYVTNLLGNPDYSQFDVTIIQSFDAIRDDLVLMFQTRYGRSKWADDGSDGLLPPDVATPSKVKADILEVMRTEERLGIVQNVTGLASQIVVQKVGANCEFAVPADIVDGLQAILGKVVLIRNAFAA